MGYPRQQRSRQLVKARRSSGALTLNSTSWANVDTNLDLTLDEVQVGDELVYGISGLVVSEVVDLYFDVVTIVSASPVNSFGTQGAAVASPGVQGVQGWWCRQGVFVNLSGESTPYTVVAGDLDSESVTLRLRYATASATNRQVNASTNNPLDVWVMNLGPAS